MEITEEFLKSISRAGIKECTVSKKCAEDLFLFSRKLFNDSAVEIPLGGVSGTYYFKLYGVSYKYEAI